MRPFQGVVQLAEFPLDVDSALNSGQSAAKRCENAIAGGAANLSAMPTVTELEGITGLGAVIGTIVCMSPEQVRGEDLDARTDLFSFGVSLYQMATGALPFRGDTSGIISDAILNRAPVPPVRLNPDVCPLICLKRQKIFPF